MNEPTLPKHLWVYLEDTRAGTLHRTEPLSFTYDSEWIAQSRAPIHPDIPVAPGVIQTPILHAFFENLLPEGDQRRLLALRHHVTSVFGMLAIAGGDTAGAIVLTPEGAEPQPPVYQSLTWEQCDALIHADAAHAHQRDTIEAAALAAGMPTQRISISGAQAKFLLSLDATGAPLRPMGTSPSTHILKPDMVRNDINIFASAANETIVMLAARLCDLPVARVSYQPVVKACLVERYDRIPGPNGTLKRLWQADFCQILGKPSTVKYEADGGPTFKECYDVLDRSAQPAVDKRNLLRWLFFNLYVGNNDSHAKNLSLLATDGGIRLAPFYDLMSTRIYSGLGPNFAFSIGGEFEPGKMGPTHLEDMARQLGINFRYLSRMAFDMARAVEVTIATAETQIASLLDHSDKVLVERLVQSIGSNAKKIRKRLFPEIVGGNESDIEDPEAPGA
jgi:serine/threonine-protein kinase HipA